MRRGECRMRERGRQSEEREIQSKRRKKSEKGETETQK